MCNLFKIYNVFYEKYKNFKSYWKYYILFMCVCMGFVYGVYFIVLGMY